MKYQVYVVIYTTVGTFEGYASEDFDVKEKAEDLRDYIQEQMRNEMFQMTIFSADDLKHQITLQPGIMHNAVAKFSISQNEE